MYKDQVNRIESIITWLEKDMQDNATGYSKMEKEHQVEVILEKIRHIFYIDYSLWNHEYDLIERIVRRKIENQFENLP